MKNVLRVWLFPVFFLATAQLARADAFTPGCPVPFAAIAQTHPIDAQCGNEGSFAKPADDTPAHRAQNRAKNNLCAPGTPARITTKTMKSLQSAADTLRTQHKLKFGTRTSLPADRTVLVNLVTTSDGNQVGEGTLVRFVGFVRKAKNQGTESVTCNLSGKHEDNDIHIALLGPNSQHVDCQTITAELIPHLRPAAWTVARLNAVTHPVRITGQLFFDASHEPCRGGTVGTGNPKRFSEWEIHPVYAIDVCQHASAPACKFDEASVWTPLDQLP